MTEYQESDLIRLAKRDHNTKRVYLLVNPLQGKHIPVSPTRSLAMMEQLGRKVAQAHPEADLVIGFAETATAVAAAVAGMLGTLCFYLQTSREPAVAKAEVLSFQEEHSHATDQFLFTGGLRERIRQARKIVFVDDELSTGKTLINIIAQMRDTFPEMEEKPLVAASLINRLSGERTAELKARGVDCVALLQLPLRDYTEAVRGFGIDPALPAATEGAFETLPFQGETPDPRFGVEIRDYARRLDELCDKLIGEFGPRLSRGRVTLIGTEEYMLPGLLLGRRMEEAGLADSVRFHATTRSPIGICRDPAYPIHEGYLLPSFYETGRKTYLYNIEACDTAVLWTDAGDLRQAETAAGALAGVLARKGCGRVILIWEKTHVQHL